MQQQRQRPTTDESSDTELGDTALRIAPLPQLEDETINYLQGIVGGVYRPGQTFAYHDLRLHIAGQGRVLRVEDTDGEVLDILNLTAFQRVSDVAAALDELNEQTR